MPDDIQQSVAERLRQARAKQAAKAGGQDLTANIPRLDDTATIPLASGQHRLWYLNQIDEHSAVYNIVSAWQVDGELACDAFAAAMTRAVRDNETLRTAFVIDDEQPVQKINAPWQVEVEPIDCQDDDDVSFNTRLQADIERPFDLAAAPLFRCLLYQRSQCQVLLFVFHHAVFDGLSVTLLLRQLQATYRERVARDDTSRAEDHDNPSPPALRYRDYAAWQQRWLQSDQARAQLDFWVAHHHGQDTPLDLPLDFARPAEQSYRGSSVSARLPAATLTQFQSLLSEEKSSLFMGLLAVLSITLQKYSSQEAINIAAPVSGRTRSEFAELLGFFANTLVFHVAVDPQQSLREHLTEVRDLSLAGYQHQELPFDQLVSRIDPPRDTSRTPLFQVMLALEERNPDGMHFGETALTHYTTDINVARTDLTFWVEQHDEGLEVVLEYSTDLFLPETAQRMATHFCHAIAVLSAAPDAPIAMMSLAGEQDRMLREKVNNTHRDYPEQHALALLETGMQQNPAATAVICDGQALTHADLSHRANQLASLLTASGAGAGDCIGICLQRSPDMIAAIIAIWRLGAAYLPLDPEFPAQRLQYMLDRTTCKVVLTDDQSHVASLSRAVFIPVTAATETDSETTTPPTEPEAVAYTIFTSGSTGNPKGVVVPQRAVANFLQSMQEAPGFAANQCLLAVTTLSFDISVLELLLPVVSGGTVIIATRNDTMDGRRLAALIDEHEVDTMQATPTTWRLLLAEGWQAPQGFRALCGGEALPGDLAIALHKVGSRLWNMYGPTETTVWSTCTEVVDEQVSLGLPIANTCVYVLDDGGLPCPAGVPGELAIGGSGVTQGYLGEAELTARQFIKLSLPEYSDPVLVYRTGDQVVQQADGRLTYFGRRDQQVKVRGFRIETGDIETALAEHPQVAQAAVILRQLSEDDARLIAYICFKDSNPVANIQLRKHLNTLLPTYMVPQQFVPITEMPLTANGKTDRKVLIARRDDTAIRSAFTPPATATEQAIAAIWCELIGCERVSCDSLFFDAGGHSLLSIRVLQRIEAQFGVRLGARDMMLNTLAQLAARVDQQAAAPEQNETTKTPPGKLAQLLKNPFRRD